MKILNRIKPLLLLSFTFLVFRLDAVADNITHSTKFLITHLSNLDSILSNEALFQPINQKLLNAGKTSDQVWLKLEPKTLAKLEEKYFLEIDNPSIDTIIYYVFQEGKLVHEGLVGENLPFFERPQKVSNFQLEFPNTRTTEVFIRISSEDQIIFSLNARNAEDTQTKNEHTLAFYGLYAGIMLGLFLYNLFLLFSTKEKLYFWYVLHTLFVFLNQAALQGFAYQYFWPEQPWFHNVSKYLFTCLVSIAGIEFFRIFLHTQEKTPKYDRILVGTIWIYALIIVLSLSGFISVTYYAVLPIQAVIPFFILFLSAKFAIQGYKPARIYLIAWSFLILGVVAYVLKDVGILPYNWFTIHAILIGSAFEVILLSFALANKLKILTKEKEASQLEALRMAQKNEQLVLEQNSLLEKQVLARTEELNNTNKSLSLTLNNLQNTQTQLVESEKMASLGQLTAGLAHEINNPINFVCANILPLKRDLEDLIQIIDEVEAEADAEHKNIIHRKKEKLDYEYIIKEIGDLMNGMEDGANRTVEIVRSLRTFSRVDEQDLKFANIEEGLNSTLVLLNSSMGGTIEVHKDFGNVAEVECYPGKLNQVFMNFLSNAIYSIKTRYQQNYGGAISIKTWEDETHVHITFEDNGVGMNEETKTKIFEPFFTTKPVGEGTGLGLSIVYRIIESHQGRLSVNSELNKGAKFILSLPKMHHQI